MHELALTLGVITAASGLAVFVTGTLAYLFKSRQMRREGKQPPPFLKFVFYPKPLPDRVRIPRLVRVVLGLVLVAGGALFLLVAYLVVSDPQLWKRVLDSLLLRLPVLVFFACLGAAIAYTGFRLIVMGDQDPLFWSSRGSEPGEK